MADDEAMRYAIVKLIRNGEPVGHPILENEVVPVTLQSIVSELFNSIADFWTSGQRGGNLETELVRGSWCGTRA